MSDDKNYITPQGLKKLKDEYQHLVHKARPETVKVVAWAASLGDRSENADYIYNKRKLREIERRLGFLLDRIEKAIVVDPKTLTTDRVVFGVTVIVLGDDEVEKTYQIVGEDEFDIKLGKISWRSPLAVALMGKKVGDEVKFKKPSGEEWLEIVDIRVG